MRHSAYTFQEGYFLFLNPPYTLNDLTELESLAQILYLHGPIEGSILQIFVRCGYFILGPSSFLPRALE